MLYVSAGENPLAPSCWVNVRLNYVGRCMRVMALCVVGALTRVGVVIAAAVKAIGRTPLIVCVDARFVDVV